MRRIASWVFWVWLPPLAAVLGFAWGLRTHRVISGAADSPRTQTQSAADARLQGSYRFSRAGWIYIHLEGSPEQIGFQHGYWLAEEIADAFAAVRFLDTHDTGKNWEFFRQAAHQMLWPKIDPEYQQELQGIVEGLEARGVPIDLDDLVAFNAFEELPGYYVPWYNAQHPQPGARQPSSPGNCSAFVATGSYTRDGRVVIAHNNWTSYLTGERWRIIFDIVPQHGYRILMDGFPGVIASDDDFGLNAAGLLVTETTISQFSGWDPNGKPEFMRARKALQYADSIDAYVRIMLEGNNGGYANDWLLADRKTGEIARFELGLKHDRVWRTRDGYFVGSNFPSDPAVIAEETRFDPHDASNSANARRLRWEQLMQQYRGQIDATLAQRFLADHFDAYTGRSGPDQRTLCGHVDQAAEGIRIWDWGPFYPGGAVQGKVSDGQLAAQMSFLARLGHPCGEPFRVGDFLAVHPEYLWMAPFLRDMPAYPWTLFRAGDRATSAAGH